MPRRASFEDRVARLFAALDRNGPIPPHAPELGPCWVWTKYRQQPSGYGVCYITGRESGPRYVHRIVEELVRGPIPPGLLVLHKCDNPPCSRPSHLFRGTPKDNIADARNKGRLSAGSRHFQAMLAENQVFQIRHRHKEFIDTLSIEFGVSTGVIRDVVRLRTYQGRTRQNVSA